MSVDSNANKAEDRKTGNRLIELVMQDMINMMDSDIDNFWSL